MMKRRVRRKVSIAVIKRVRMTVKVGVKVSVRSRAKLIMNIKATVGVYGRFMPG